ncbi:Ktr system potassium transporter B, partial [Bacillus cereus]|nr:Ktr system potassium transporter B [Bacillus cereus]
MEVTKKQGLYNRLIRLNPPQILALGFFCLIVVGGLLLKLPLATKAHIS